MHTEHTLLWALHYFQAEIPLWAPQVSVWAQENLASSHNLKKIHFWGSLCCGTAQGGCLGIGFTLMALLWPDGLEMGVVPWGQSGCSQHSCVSADWLFCFLTSKCWESLWPLLPFGTDVFVSLVFLTQLQVLPQEERLWLLSWFVSPINYVPTMLWALLKYVTYLWLSVATTVSHLSVFPT